jgi:hypothetical protein
MIDVKHPLRKAYFDLLNGVLFYNTVPVSVGDDTVDSDDPIYVILANQTGRDESTFQTFDSVETINIEVVAKGASFTNKNVVDNIASQILGLLLPSPQVNGLPQQIGIQINCVQLTGDTYLGFSLNAANSVVRRILTVTQKVRQTTDPSYIPVGPDGAFAQVVNEIPSGLVNGSNKVFTTAKSFIASSVEVSLNGLRQVPGLHFTITLPNIITFIDAPQTDIVNGSDNILIDYISTP